MSLSKLECLINSGLFAYIDRSEYFDLMDSLDVVERKYKRDEPIFYEGDTIKRVCIISSGSVRSEKNYSDGEVHILSVFDANSVFGLEITMSQLKTTPVNFIANEPTSVLYLSIDSLETHKYRKPVKKALIEMLADENIRMMHKIEILAERGLRDRIIVYLNVLARRAKSNTVQVSMSREQMAQYLCVNRSALSNELSKMKQEGILDFDRHTFRLLQYDEDGMPLSSEEE